MGKEDEGISHIGKNTNKSSEEGNPTKRKRSRQVVQKYIKEGGR